MPTIKTGTKDTNKVVTSLDSKSNGKKNENEDKSNVESSKAEHRSKVGVERMGNLRNKFESGEVSEKKTKKKSAPKIKYAGAESVKMKFIETATKGSNESANGPRGPKEITPPPAGVAVGVLESQPQPRAPDVVTADDMLEPVDLSMISETTKNLRAKFKQLEETGGKMDVEKSTPNELMEEFKTVAPEASRSRARWRDIESGKVEAEPPTERPKIDVRGEGYGGVYENEPEQLDNITRGGQDNKDLPAGISARERREEFLRKASEATTVKKDPTKLIDINAAESGIYENEPTRREDVVRYDDEQTDDYPPTSAKWASEAKNRFMQEASKAQEKTQRNQTIVEDLQKVGGESEIRFATQAKQAFLERQRHAEEAAKNKARPDIIDIWGEQCAHSGVFENTPAARSADVVAGYGSDEESEEEED